MFKNRIRLPFYLSKPQFPVEKTVFRKADGSTKLLSAIIRNTYEGKTDHLPEDWHRKLVIALAHDTVTIEDNRFLSDVVIDGDYGIDWSDFLNNPVAQANFTIQVTPFDATNNNCQSCSEITQLDLVDDHTDVVWTEGTENVYPDLITANDTICCFPYTVEIVSFNTDFFTSVTVDQTGLLTAILKASVPDITDLLLCTYRVTCDNGSYDEANVYCNISGTSTDCIPPSALYIVQDPIDDTKATAIWTNVVGQSYDWNLYLSSDLFTPVLSGGGTTPTAELTGIIAGLSYTFVVISDCGEGIFSIPVSVVFQNTAKIPESCGNFTVTYAPPLSPKPESFSYMDCNAEIKNQAFATIGSVDVCMLINPSGTTPIFFSPSSPYITITYIGLC